MERVQYTTSSLSSSELVSVDEVKTYLGIYAEVTSDDALMEGLIEAAISYVSNYLEESVRSTNVVDYFSKLDKRLELSHSIEETSVPVVEVMLSSGWTPYTGASTPDRTSSDGGLILEVLPITLEPVTNPVRVSYSSLSDAMVTHQHLLKNVVLLLVRILYEERSDDLDPRRMSLITRRIDHIRRQNSGMTINGASTQFRACDL